MYLVQAAAEDRCSGAAVEVAEKVRAGDYRDESVGRWKVVIGKVARELGAELEKKREVFGEGGVLYTQPFVISDGSDTSVKIVDSGFVDFGVFDFLVAVFNNWFEIIGRFFNNIF